VTIEIRPRPGGFVAEVIGMPPGLRVSDTEFERVANAWYAHSVLVFRDFVATPAEHVAFTRRFGPLHIMVPTDYNLEDHPEVFVVGNDTEDGKAVGLRRAGMGFHTDGEDKALPNAGSLLHAIQIPPEGGDTLFADLYAAYEALAPDVKRRIAGRRARFSRIALHAVHYLHLAPFT